MFTLLNDFPDKMVVFVVHGDAEARASLQKALRERGRRVELPRAGQAFELRFRGKRPEGSLAGKSFGSSDSNRPLDLSLLWRKVADPGGNYFTLAELARAWWGDETRAAELRDALEKDAAHFFCRTRFSTRSRLIFRMLARETLREREMLKGPSIYREEKRIALAVRGSGDLASAGEQFRATSGYTLNVTFANVEIANNLVAAPTPGALEINAALGLIRAQLAGTTLYRTSLKGSEIVLSFISPQVGARYRAKMDELARTTGWALAINSQPNQNAIIQVAQELIARGLGRHAQSQHPQRSWRGARCDCRSIPG